MLSSSCTPYNATYRLKIHYLDGVHGVDVLEETTHGPIASLDKYYNYGDVKGLRVALASLSSRYAIRQDNDIFVARGKVRNTE